MKATYFDPAPYLSKARELDERLTLVDQRISAVREKIGSVPEILECILKRCPACQAIDTEIAYRDSRRCSTEPLPTLIRTIIRASGLSQRKFAARHAIDYWNVHQAAMGNWEPCRCILDALIHGAPAYVDTSLLKLHTPAPCKENRCRLKGAR